MTFRRPSAAKLTDAAFFAGFLAYAIFGIDTRLVYHWQTPAFYVTFDFFAAFLRYPGGLADLLYLLSAQAYPSQAIGALVLTAEAVAITILAERCCRALPILRFFPALLLAYTSSFYYDRTPVAAVLLLGLAATAAFLNTPGRHLWLALLLLGATYYAGGMAVVVFGAAAAAILAVRGLFAEAITITGAAAALPAVAHLSRIVDVPALAPVFTVACLFAAMAGSLSSETTPRHWKWMSAVALAALAGVAVYAYRGNDRDRRLAEVDYHTTREEWPQVIAAATRLRSKDFNSLTRYEVNLALHETGRLGDEMFRFPQSGAVTPPLRSETFLPYMIRVTDFLLRVGRLNDAEHFGNEAMVLGDSDPRVMKLLAEVEIAKGQSAAARKYLSALSVEAHSAEWARDRLRDGGTVRNASRRAARTDDFIPVWQNPDKPDADIDRLLADQLDADPTNRMAFEFLMGNRLLARDLAGARALMPRIAAIAEYGGRTPRHYQEAMAMYADGSGQRIEIPGFPIEPETFNRMAVFKRVIAQSPGRDAAMQATWDRFRDSYFFYFVFGPGDYR